MYTQVSFGQFLDGLLRQSGVEFKRYPNPAIDWWRGDWGYEILRDMSVRLFRCAGRGEETTIAGPPWDDARETRESFERRFNYEFRVAIVNLR